MNRLTVEQATGRLGELVDAAVGGQEIVLVHGEGSAVRLVPVAAGKAKPRFGSAKGLIEMADDFDAPLPDFHEYME
jgi:antitoxin (DNA-binding transcriptional repressor) of toxin-antitoxin stability system